MHVRLGQEDGACGPKPLDDERVLAGHHALQRQRSRRRWHVRRLIVVLHDEGDAVQWTGGARLFEEAIELRRARACPTVDRDQRVDRRATFVVGLDAAEITLHDSTTGRRRSRSAACSSSIVISSSLTGDGPCVRGISASASDTANAATAHVHDLRAAGMVDVLRGSLRSEARPRLQRLLQRNEIEVEAEVARAEELEALRGSPHRRCRPPDNHHFHTERIAAHARLVMASPVPGLSV